MNTTQYFSMVSSPVTADSPSCHLNGILELITEFDSKLSVMFLAT